MQEAVRDHIPLEQGLRPELSSKTEIKEDVRDHIPLEQGLRQPETRCLYARGLSETIFH